MFTIADAEREIDARLGDTPRAAHSRFVGEAMRRVAAHLGQNQTVWELTGLCHDLDFEVTRGTPERHGLLAAEWLAQSLPPEALLAIRAHDHRSGATGDLPICKALRMTDALAVIAEALPLRPLPFTRDALAASFPDRPWLVPILVDNADELGVTLTVLGDIVSQSGYVGSIDV